MAHYRKVDTRILLDQKFNQLSSDARLVFLHRLIHPNLTSLGAMHASLASIACELDWRIERLKAAMEETKRQGMVRFDEKARFVWLPHFLKYNAPATPNVVKSWPSVLQELPECFLRDLVIQHTKRFVQGLSPSFQVILDDCTKATGE